MSGGFRGISAAALMAKPSCGQLLRLLLLRLLLLLLSL
jgi:hypothetical protein